MDLSSKKLTHEQQKVLEESTQQLRDICIPSVHAWEKFLFDMQYPMTVCDQAIIQGRGIEDIEPKAEELISSALKSVKKYQKILIPIIERFKLIGFENWYPKDYKKERESWKEFFEGQLKCIPSIIDALSKPDALHPILPMDIGGKLCVFFQTVHLISMYRTWDIIENNLI